MTASVARLSLYALISAIEEDLREALVCFMPNHGNSRQLLGEDLFKKLADRCESELDDTTGSLAELVQYADFGDSIQLARTYLDSLPSALASQLKANHQSLIETIPVRNRVMHSRPLEFDDLAKVTDLSETLTTNTAHWPQLRTIKTRLSCEPDLLLKLSIPFEPDGSSVSHNLPLPDFDETGFIGRKSTVTNLKKAISGVYPVITIVGEGGLGKTSLALKVAYDLIDQDTPLFDALVFVSAKTQKLTENEITRIKGAINTSVGLIESAARSLGGETSNTMDDLIELMEQFRILLIIDNLETVLDDNIRSLMERLPAGSKILITTRIRLGAFEFPIQLESLSPTEATQLLRATAKARECSRLVLMPDAKLQTFCQRMHNNPLHIKWFVSAVQSGQRPEAVLADNRLFLQFCLSNVFNVISADGRRLVRTLLSLGGSYTMAELAFLTSMDQTTLLRAIGELMKTNMFISVSKPTERSFETKYELSTLARAYLNRFYPVNKAEQQDLVRQKQRLISGGERIQSDSERNPLAPSNIHCRTRSDWVIAKYLRDALTKIRLSKVSDAFDIINEAKSLAPDFSEVHRIEAYAHVRAGNISNAYDCYERALEFAPESPVTRLLFGLFLLREVNDTDSAVDHLKTATELCPAYPEPRIELTRAYLYLHRFDEARTQVDALEALSVKDIKIQTKITDLHLQLLSRSADYYQSNGEFREALETLETTREYFLGISNPDLKMRERVTKLRLTASALRSNLAASDEFERATALLQWIEQASSAPEMVASHPTSHPSLNLESEGAIKQIHHSQRFGFISEDNGGDLFFHANYTSHRMSDFYTGQRVRFEVTIDWRGRVVAKNVSPV